MTAAGIQHSCEGCRDRQVLYHFFINPGMWINRCPATASDSCRPRIAFLNDDEERKAHETRATMPEIIATLGWTMGMAGAHVCGISSQLCRISPGQTCGNRRIT
jgi:hypothetical protein